MRKLILFLGILSLCLGEAFAKPNAIGVQHSGASQVVERGPDFNRVQHVTSFTNSHGEVIQTTNHYTVLATGLNIQAKDGGFIPADPKIEIKNNVASASKTRHKVNFYPNIADARGAIELFAPDSKKLRSRPLGISYYEITTGRSVLIGEIKESIGQVDAANNRVIYSDCFTDVKCDLVYENRLSGMEQNLVFREQPPAPSEFGLDEKATVIQLLTEFFDPPAVKKTSEHRKGVASDASLDFGAVKMSKGKAFSIGNAGKGKLLPVSKHWQKLEGRDFLIEEIEYGSFAPEANTLPRRPVTQNGKLRRPVAAVKRSLRKVFASKEPSSKSMRLADNVTPVNGFVLDYSVAETTTDLTLQAGNTYYVEGFAILDGVTTIEGGAVVKYAVGGMLQIEGAVRCLTESYHPAIFTAKDDNTVGEEVEGSTGYPTGYYATCALNFVNTGFADDIKYIRVRYASNGVVFDLARTDHPTLRHSQIMNCDIGMQNVNTESVLENNLFWHINWCFYDTFSKVAASHLTVHEVNLLGNFPDFDDTQHSLTNCLMVAVTNINTANITFVSSATNAPVDTFEIVGGGSHYLPTNSVYRNYGTSNIAPDLLSALGKKTTEAPTVLSDIVIYGNRTFDRKVQRDNDLPDLGYHYEPLDYAISSLTIGNGIITITNGCAVAGFGSLLITFQNTADSTNAAAFQSEGTPFNMNHLCDYRVVQESSGGSWSPGSAIIAVDSILSKVTIKCTDASIGIGDWLDGAPLGATNIVVSDSVFSGCYFQVFSYGTASLRNNLFNNADSYIFALDFVAHNNLFRSGRFGFEATGSTQPDVRNNIFDSCTIYTEAGIGDASGHSHNALVNVTQMFPGGVDLWNPGPTDQPLTSIAYEVGPLGHFYLPSNSVLINAGNQSAASEGLYHYTTQVNQSKDTSTVDIGLHYIALDGNGNPVDSDNDTIPDYVEDWNGNGVADSGESNWQDTPPQITVQPQSQQVAASSSVALSVTASGSTPLTYQWRRNGINISGGTGSNYTIPSVQSADVGVYSVIVSNFLGTILSSDAVVSLTGYGPWTETFESGLGNWTVTGVSPVTPLVQSTAQNHTAGGANAAKTSISSDRMYRNLGAELEGNSKITFWIYDSGPNALPRAYGEVRSYTGSGFGGTSGLQQILAIGRYGVSFGTGNGTLAGETVDGNKYQGRVSAGVNSGWFNLNATGAPNRSTGWHKFEIERLADGTTINFYVDGILGRTIAAATAATWDSVTIGAVGSGSSPFDAWFDDIKPEIVGLPVITSQPVDRSATIGATATFSVTATGNVTGYQWRFNGMNISGATGATLNLSNVQDANAGLYTVIVKNAVGATVSTPVTLTILHPPTIVTQPVNRTGSAGGSVSFQVVATGPGTLTYQWKKNGVALVNSANVLNATTDQLTLLNLAPGDEGSYTVTVSNSSGSITSSAALLTVNTGVVFIDNFEGGLGYWTTVPGATALTLSSGQANPVSGSKTAYETSSLNKMYHNLGTEVSGRSRATFWIYNATTTSPTRSFAEVRGFAGSGLNNGALQQIFAVGNYTVPFDQNTGTLQGESANNSLYQARVYSGVNNGWFNLNAPGLPARTAGWHRFSVEKSTDGKTVHFFVDGVYGRTINDVTPASWDVVEIGSAGIGTGVSEAAWFDDVKVEALTSVITSQPASTVAAIGNSVTFAVGATGSNLQYQWRKNGVAISAATLSSYTIPSVQATDEASYSVLVTTATDREYSALAQLTPVSVPVITTQPAATQTIGAGSNAVFRVTASGGALSYQWKLGGVNIIDDARISGSTTSSLTISGISQADAGSYSVTVFNLAGTTLSSTATLTVKDPPVIIVPPQSQEAPLGGSMTLTATIGGSPSFTYQWQKNGANISGATSSSLALTGLTAANSGLYSLVVANIAGTSTSSLATLKVVSTPTICTQPTSQTVNAGQNVQFSVAVCGPSVATLPSVSSGTLTLWLKADQGVVANSDGLVERWNDQSGNSNDATQQISDANKPSVINNAVLLSGKPVIRFNGIQDETTGHYLVGTSDLHLTNAYTSFVVYSRMDQNSGSEKSLVMVGAPMDFNHVRGQAIIGDQMTFSAWNNDYPSGFIVTNNTFRIASQRMDANKTVMESYDADENTTRHFVNSISGVLDPAAGYYIGGLADQTRNFKGDIAEVIYYRGQLTDADRQAVENYLRQKYFTTVATSSYSYQWKKNDANIAGATISSLAITSATQSDAGSYTVAIGNAAGSVSSAAATLTVNDPPVIVQQPVSQTANAGSSVTFSVTATGNGPLNYQWKKDGNAVSDGATVSGSTTASLTLAGVLQGEAGAYSVAVANGAGAVASDNAVLTVTDPVVITQPSNQTLNEGQTAVFGCVVNGTLPLTYQWRRNGVNLVEGGRISGANSPTLTIAAVTTSDAASYDLVVNNSAGEVLSSIVELTVAGALAPPAFSRPAGSYPAAMDVAVTASTNTATIHYTTDGSDPTENDAVVPSGEVVSVNHDLTLKARAYSPGLAASPVSVADYTLVGAIAVGGFQYSMALKPDGSVWAWGANGSGQLGDGGTVSRLTVGPVSLTDVTMIAAGMVGHNLAVKRDGTVWTWGFNGSHQLGDGTTNNGLLPQQVATFWNYSANVPFNNVKAISAGRHHSMVINGDGRLVAWGGNWTGQLGVGRTNSYELPELAGTGQELRAIAAGDSHSVIIRSDGIVMVCGDNSRGQVMGTIFTPDRPYPSFVQVSGISGGVMAAAGYAFSSVVTSAGEIWSWGQNSVGQMGNGSVSTVSHAAKANGNGYVAVAAGAYHVVALKSDGTVWTWGSNDSGQLGNGTTANSSVPVNVSGLTGIIGVAACYSQSMALKNDGTIWAWGYNANGQLGDGTTVDRSAPVQVAGLTLSSPVIMTQPTGQTVSVGSSATFKVVAAGMGTLNYQWKKNNIDLQNGGKISGADGAELTITDVGATEAGDYSVLVSNNGGSVASEQASLSISVTPLSISPKSGGYTSIPEITIFSLVPDVTIRYTVDGTEPTMLSGAAANSGVALANLPQADFVLKAKAFKTGLIPSETLVATYSLIPQTPYFSPPGGFHGNDETVSIGCSTPNATIRYTTDGNEPTATSPIYSGQNIPITDGLILKAKAWKDGKVSPTGSQTYKVRAAPSNDNIDNATPLSGSYGTIYANNFSATLEGQDERDWFFEGWMPNHSIWFDWTAPDPLPAGVTSVLFDVSHSDFQVPYIMALVGDTSDGWTHLSVAPGGYLTDEYLSFDITAGETYHIGVYGDPSSSSGAVALTWMLNQTTVPVHIVPDSGTYTTPIVASIDCPLKNAPIHYTLNGRDPTDSDPMVSPGETILVAKSAVLKAKILGDNMPSSPVISTSYIIDALAANPTPIVDMPAFDKPSQVFSGSLTVNITTGTAGAEIHYTLDGSEPTMESPVGATVLVDHTVTLRARAWKAGMNASSIASVVYVKTGNENDSDKDGVPDDWEYSHGSLVFVPDANQPSNDDKAHGLTNAQMYNNPSVSIADNYSTVGDGIPDWWKLKNGLSINDGNIANAIGNNNLSIYQSFTGNFDPNDPNSRPDQIDAPDFRVVRGNQNHYYLILSHIPKKIKAYRIFCTVVKGYTPVQVITFDVFPKDGQRTYEIGNGNLPPDGQFAFELGCISDDGTLKKADIVSDAFFLDYPGSLRPDSGDFSASVKEALKKRLRVALYNKYDNSQPIPFAGTDWGDGVFRVTDSGGVYIPTRGYVDFDGTINPDYIYLGAFEGAGDIHRKYYYPDYEPPPFLQCDWPWSDLSGDSEFGLFFQNDDQGRRYLNMRAGKVNKQQLAYLAFKVILPQEGNREFIITPGTSVQVATNTTDCYLWQNVEQPSFNRIGYLFNYSWYQGVDDAGDSPAELSYRSGDGPYSNPYPFIMTGVGQSLNISCYSKESILRSDNVTPIPGEFGYLEQYFDKAYLCDSTEDVPRTATPNLDGKMRIDTGAAAAMTSGLLSPYGVFTPEKAGKYILTTKPDQDGNYGEIAVYVIDMQVDANHDGDIDNKDLTDRKRSMLFWANDDRDRYTTMTDNKTWEYSDVNLGEPKIPVGEDVADYLVKDVTDPTKRAIPSERDLEDYARLSLPGLSALMHSMPSSYSVELFWADPTTAPGISIFAAVERDGGTRYLTDEATASTQTVTSGTRWVGALDSRSPRLTLNQNSVFTDGNYIPEHFIFCGSAPGKGQLYLIIKNVDGGYVAYASVFIQIAKIGDMYDHFTTGDSNVPRIAVPMTALPAIGTSKFIAETDDYILFAHGWRMQPWERRRFAETAFKRLYWEGFSGRFGLFSYPTEWNNGTIPANAIDPQNFNRSEFQALSSGRALAGVVRYIDGLEDGRYHNKIRGFAHSQGNFDMGEGMRILAAEGGPKLHTYVATQAATVALMYDTTVPLIFYGPTINDPAGPSTPEVYGNYFSTLAANKCVNFFNELDYPTGPNIWERNEQLKPDRPPVGGEILGDGYACYFMLDFYRQNYDPGALQWVNVRHLTFESDTYEIYAHVAEARSRSLAHQRFVAGPFYDGRKYNQIDMNQDFGFDGGDQTQHSAEFLSTFARRKCYWRQMMIQFGLCPSL